MASAAAASTKPPPGDNAPRRRHRRRLCVCLLAAAAALALSLAVLRVRDPTTRLLSTRPAAFPSPSLQLNVTLLLTVAVHNPNAASFAYASGGRAGHAGAQPGLHRPRQALMHPSISLQNSVTD
ncbi:hypothetical protein ACP4OV_003617 [Aristida adscensionis]